MADWGLDTAAWFAQKRKQNTRAPTETDCAHTTLCRGWKGVRIATWVKRRKSAAPRTPSRRTVCHSRRRNSRRQRSSKHGRWTEHHGDGTFGGGGCEEKLPCAGTEYLRFNLIFSNSGCYLFDMASAICSASFSRNRAGSRTGSRDCHHNSMLYRRYYIVLPSFRYTLGTASIALRTNWTIE
jgi:hypothetical protein